MPYHILRNTNNIEFFCSQPRWNDREGLNLLSCLKTIRKREIKNMKQGLLDLGHQIVQAQSPGSWDKYKPCGCLPILLERAPRPLRGRTRVELMEPCTEEPQLGVCGTKVARVFSIQSWRGQSCQWEHSVSAESPWSIQLSFGKKMPMRKLQKLGGKETIRKD